MPTIRRYVTTLCGLTVGLAAVLLTCAPTATSDSDWPPASRPDAEVVQLSDSD